MVTFENDQPLGRYSNDLCLEVQKSAHQYFHSILLRVKVRSMSKSYLGMPGGITYLESLLRANKTKTENPNSAQGSGNLI